MSSNYCISHLLHIIELCSTWHFCFRFSYALVTQLPQPASCCKMSSTYKQLSATTALLYLYLLFVPKLSISCTKTSYGLRELHFCVHLNAGIYVLPPTTSMHFLNCCHDCWKWRNPGSFPDIVLYVWHRILDVRPCHLFHHCLYCL